MRIRDVSGKLSRKPEKNFVGELTLLINLKKLGEFQGRIVIFQSVDKTSKLT
jgi:hypothetical protein